MTRVVQELGSTNANDLVQLITREYEDLINTLRPGCRKIERSRFGHLPIDVAGRTRSITIPTVSAKRTGL